jgi:isocitrate dehydrogenase
MFKLIKIPDCGSIIKKSGDSLLIPDNPVIPFIEGDGIGIDIMAAAIPVFNAAIDKAYNSMRNITWLEIFAGEKANLKYGDYLPEDTVKAIDHFSVAIKGPLQTPVGGGMRSLNVALRRKLDLFACVRPVRYFPGVAAPVRNPELLDIVIFRENTEDVYSGIEFERGSEEAYAMIEFLKRECSIWPKSDTAFGIKPISSSASKRLVRSAILYAIENRRKSVCLVHKGNIMKYTEGAFLKWGYEIAKEEFSDVIITEKDLKEKHGGNIPDEKILINDCIADNMFQQLLLNPAKYDVIATTNLNGDYLSDAAAAQVGGLGLAPGGNIGDNRALFEATHGTAPDIAGKGIANPSSLILSGVMMLEYLGWKEAADLITCSLEKTIAEKNVTSDLASGMEGAKIRKTSEFAEKIIKNM